MSHSKAEGGVGKLRMINFVGLGGKFGLRRVFMAGGFTGLTMAGGLPLGERCNAAAYVSGDVGVDMVPRLLSMEQLIGFGARICKNKEFIEIRC